MKTAWMVECEDNYESGYFDIGIASSIEAAYRLADDHARESHGVLFRRMIDEELDRGYDLESEPADRTPRRKVWLGVAKRDSYEGQGLAGNGDTIQVWYDRHDLHYYAYEWLVAHE